MYCLSIQCIHYKVQEHWSVSGLFGCVWLQRGIDGWDVGRPQGGGDQPRVDRGSGVKNVIFLWARTQVAFGG